MLKICKLRIICLHINNICKRNIRINREANSNKCDEGDNNDAKCKSMDVTEGCPSQRCVTFVEFNNGLSIVNTHFCGGKYDDRHFVN